MKLGLFAGYWGMGITGAEQLVMAQEADRLGYDSVWAAEAYGNDAATVLAWLASNTEKTRIASGIFQMPARTPAMTAMTAATLDNISEGRFTLGLGISGPQVVEGWHGQPFDKPLARTREYVDIVRMALARETVRYDGEFYKLPLPNGTGLGKPLKLIIKPVQERIPIYLAAIGPKNTALAAEIADGWLPTLFAPEHVDTFRPSLEEGAARAGRTLDDLDITPLTPTAIYDDIEHARNFLRPQLALYIGGHGRAREELLQQARDALRLRRRGQGDPGSVPLGQAGRGDGKDPRRPDRQGGAHGPEGTREGTARRIPRGGRRDTARDAGGRHPGGPAADDAGPGRDCRLTGSGYS